VAAFPLLAKRKITVLSLFTSRREQCIPAYTPGMLARWALLRPVYRRRVALTATQPLAAIFVSCLKLMH